MKDLELKNVSYQYRKGKRTVLKNCSATFEPGTVTSIRGRSGEGKSTLLHLIAGFDVPTEGQVLWMRKPLKITDLTEYRRLYAGIVSQSFLLFQNRTALENVCYPLRLNGLSKNDAIVEATKCLESVGLSKELYNRFPRLLSGGEQQRVAIARCLAGNYPIITADEPTGNLDGENAQAIFNLLQDAARTRGAIVVIATHDEEIAKQADAQYKLVNGELIRI